MCVVTPYNLMSWEFVFLLQLLKGQNEPANPRYVAGSFVPRGEPELRSAGVCVKNTLTLTELCLGVDTPNSMLKSQCATPDSMWLLCKPLHGTEISVC